MRAVVVGAVGSTEVLLDRLHEAPGWEVPLVVTLAENLQSRHSDFVDLAPHAQRSRARLHRTASSNDIGTLDAIVEAEPDYIFVVGWSQICGADFLALLPNRIVGYHPAPLPRLRGRAVIPWTILLGEAITAGSLFWLGTGVDDGDLLAQKYFHVSPDETAAELYAKHMLALADMLVELLPRLASGEEPRFPQDERYATWATRRTEADGAIDWSRPAVDIDRLVRAVGRPYPGAFTCAGERKMVVWRSRPVPGANRFCAMAGQIVAIDGGCIVVQTGDGLLEMHEWDMTEGRVPRLHQKLGE